ncbi:MAG TPA: hypothetical protein DF614_04875 [Methylococcaceae bacterium]|nr:hypothetical protein [Methylococcaceae bacterium]
MGIEYKKSLAVLTEFVGVEEAENLLEWLLKNPKGKINLASCVHIHAANLQVLMAVKPTISAWPADENLQHWLSVLKK